MNLVDPLINSYVASLSALLLTNNCSFGRVRMLALSVAVFIAFSGILPCIAGPCNSYEVEKSNEGYHKCVYKDSFGQPIIGVGVYLNDVNARRKIESVGGNYSAICNGSQCLSDDQIRKLFYLDMNTSVACAAKWLSNWGQLNDSVQSAIADMAFSMGCTMLQELTDVRNALLSKQYKNAVEALGSSFWCDSQQDRCERDAKCILGG